jgi:hypothetical protein
MPSFFFSEALRHSANLLIVISGFFLSILEEEQNIKKLSLLAAN